MVRPHPTRRGARKAQRRRRHQRAAAFAARAGDAARVSMRDAQRRGRRIVPHARRGMRSPGMRPVSAATCRRRSARSSAFCGQPNTAAHAPLRRHCSNGPQRIARIGVDDLQRVVTHTGRLPRRCVRAIGRGDDRDDAAVALAHACERGQHQAQFADAIGRQEDFAQPRRRPAAAAAAPHRARPIRWRSHRPAPASRVARATHAARPAGHRGR